ncbi:MAG: acyltransferase [Sterolibacteriaceae bacterium]|nr:acyltransferase [Sterolibacteriaceae bacterium]MBK9085332.1 acyltransferase [Sterolibacteriaceae bacterium]
MVTSELDAVGQPERKVELDSNDSRLLFVDGLRGVAAAMVVLYHLVGRTSAHWLTAKGYLGVSIFFVLSGFVIAMAIGDRNVTPGFLGRFAARRSLRLDPPYWLSIAIAIALMYLATRVGVKKEFPTEWDVVAHLVYLQDILGIAPISDVYWTLCLEVQFYLFLILLLWACRQRVSSLGFQFTLALLLGLSLIQNADIATFTPKGVFLPYWYGFMAGAVTYWVRAGRLPTRFLYCALAVLLIFAPFQHGDAVLVTALTASVIHIASRLGMMGTWLSGSGMQFLGKTSYSLYLFHPLIGWSAQSFALRYVNQWAALAIGIAASVVFASMAYFAIERPSIQLSHAVRMGRQSKVHP